MNSSSSSGCGLVTGAKEKDFNLLEFFHNRILRCLRQFSVILNSCTIKKKVIRLSFRSQTKLPYNLNRTTEVSCSLWKNFLSGSVFETTKSVWIRTSANQEGTMKLKTPAGSKNYSLSKTTITTAWDLPPPSTRLANLFTWYVWKNHEV